MIGRFGDKKNLRHTDGVKRGNVRSTMNEREMILGDDRKRGGIRKER